jgi:hypothetical protein
MDSKTLAARGFPLLPADREEWKTITFNSLRTSTETIGTQSGFDAAIHAAVQGGPIGTGFN